MMEELIIWKFQAKVIENALRLAMNVLESHDKEGQSAMDRELILASKIIKAVLNENYKGAPTSHFGEEKRKTV